MRTMKLSVECYSGRKADERPVRFWLGGRQYQVETVLDQWYDPEHVFYKVRADDGNLYILRQQTSTPDGPWELVSFRQAGQTVIKHPELASACDPHPSSVECKIENADEYGHAVSRRVK